MTSNNAVCQSVEADVPGRTESVVLSAYRVTPWHVFTRA
jgi:hypothetical protein